MFGFFKSVFNACTVWEGESMCLRVRVPTDVSPRTGVTHGCDFLVWHSELSCSPLEEQQALFPAELSPALTNDF